MKYKIRGNAKDNDWTLDMKPRNKIEGDFVQGMRKRGYFVIPRGWPDYVLIKYDSRPKLVEVKSENDKLRPEQLAILTLLNDYGFDVRLSDGSGEGRILTNGELEWGHRLLWTFGKNTTEDRGLQRRFPTEPIGLTDNMINGTPVYSMKQLAETLGVPEPLVVKLVLSGEIPGQSTNSELVVTKQALEEYIQKKVKEAYARSVKQGVAHDTASYSDNRSELEQS